MEIIPDISKPRIMISFAVKYVTNPNVIIIKVSVTADLVSIRRCLNIKQVKNPKKMPTKIETTPREINCPIIINGVEVVNFCPWSDLTVLKSTIDTISLNTPSPKMHE